MILDSKHFRYLEHAVFFAVTAATLRIFVREGGGGLVRAFIHSLRCVPGVNSLIQSVLSKEVNSAASKLLNREGETGKERAKIVLPKEGISHEILMKQLTELAEEEKEKANGKVFAYVYTFDENLKKITMDVYKRFSEEFGFQEGNHEQFVMAAFEQFIHGNALNPFLFSSLRKFENEVVSISADLFHGDSETCGSLTSGGTESILLAMKTYRDFARKTRSYIKNPEIIVPVSIHPAFEKAAHYFDLTLIRIEMTKEMKVNIKLVEKAINRNTILIVGSAPQYPHCIIDPIEDLSRIALKHGLPLHVDACFGGFILPFLEKLGENIPAWDFRCAGVTSISADMHKYGYCPKGASVILYRSFALRSYQYFSFSSWCGGLFGSPTMSGSRPGGNIAAAWAAFHALGENGYMELTRQALTAANVMKNGIRSISGIELLGDSLITGFAFVSSDPNVDILAVADAMEKRNWKMERQQLPPSIHCSVYPFHHTSGAAQRFVDDLRECVQTVRENKHLAKEGSAGMYGMVAAIPDKSLVDDFIIQLFGEVFRA